MTKVDFAQVATPVEREVRFKRLDRNGDGKLDSSEFVGGEARFQQLDKNKDNLLERSEIPWLKAKAEKKADKGKIARKAKAATDKQAVAAKPAEAPRAVAVPAPKPEEKVAAGAEPKPAAKDATAKPKPDTTAEVRTPVTGGSAKVPARRQALLERLKAMDKDGDGRVSRAEFSGKARLFDRLDRNHDGYLDRADRKQAKKVKAGKTPVAD
jgi:Ca2+-binding EF-hand superfamily protein